MTAAAKPNPLIELMITLIIPSLILMKLSATEDLGVVNALLVAGGRRPRALHRACFRTK